MPETLTFIHAADLHIGAPFRGLRALSDEWARRLVDAIPGAWDRVVEAAVSRKVDFMVVSGDIFDSVRASYRDYLRFFDGLNRLDAEGIPSYAVSYTHLGRLPRSLSCLLYRLYLLCPSRPMTPM